MASSNDVGIVVRSGATPSEVEVESGREAAREVLHVLRGAGRGREARVKAILSYLSKLLGVKPDAREVRERLRRLVEEARREANRLESMGLRGVYRRVDMLAKRVERLLESLDTGNVNPNELLAAGLLSNFIRNSRRIGRTLVMQLKSAENTIFTPRLKNLDEIAKRVFGVHISSIVSSEYEKIVRSIVRSLFHARNRVERHLEEKLLQLKRLAENAQRVVGLLESELEKLRGRARLAPPPRAWTRRLEKLVRAALEGRAASIKLPEPPQEQGRPSSTRESRGQGEQEKREFVWGAQRQASSLLSELEEKLANARSLDEAARLLSSYASRAGGSLSKLLTLLSDTGTLRSAVEAAVMYEWGSKVDDEALREVAGDKYALLAEAARAARRFIRGGEKHTLLSRDIIENYDSESLTLRFIRSVVGEIRKYSSYEQLLNAKAGEVVEQLEKLRRAGMALDEVVRRIEEKRRYHLVTIVKYAAGAAVQTPYGSCVRWVPPMPSARELLGMGGPVAETNPRQLAKALRDYLVGKRVRIYDAHGGLILSRAPNTVNDLESDTAYGALVVAVCQERSRWYMSMTQNNILNDIARTYGRRASKVRGIGMYLFPYPCPRYTGRGVVWLLDGKIVKLVGKARTPIVFFADDGGKVVIVDPRGGSKEASFTLRSPARVQLDGPAGVYRFRVLGYDYCIVGYQIVGPVVGA